MTTITSTTSESQTKKPRAAGLRYGYSVAAIYRSGTRPDYRGWSVEELRAFAAQMQVPHAERKSRRELLAFFGVQDD